MTYVVSDYLTPFTCVQLFEIKANYKAQHDEFSKLYYSKSSGLTKEEFDIQHAKIWTDMESELKTASDYIEPIPPRNLLTEIDDLKARLEKLENS